MTGSTSSSGVGVQGAVAQGAVTQDVDSRTRGGGGDGVGDAATEARADGHIPQGPPICPVALATPAVEPWLSELRVVVISKLCVL